MGAQGLILATVFLCPLGTIPAACKIETAIEVHMVNVRRGSCERDAQTALADAAALKDRATRRLGEIMEPQRNTVGLAKGRGRETRVI